MNNPREVEIKDGKAICFFRCSSCSDEVVIAVPVSAYLKRIEEGAAVQDAFPDLGIAEREMFVSGICGRCFQEMIREEEAYRREIEDEGKILVNGKLVLED